MAVNLSPRQLSSPNLAARRRRARCATTALPPSALCLEITESAIMEDPEAAHAHPPGPQGARRAAGDRRLRRRLLLALAPQVPAAGRRDQDRQVLRRRPARVRRQPRDHHRDHPARPRARRAGRRRGRRDRRAGRRAARRWAATSRRATTSRKPVPADYLCFSQSDSLSAASPALSPALPTPVAGLLEDRPELVGVVLGGVAGLLARVGAASPRRDVLAGS